MLIWEKAEAWNIPVMRTPRNYGKGHQTETLLDDGSAWNKAVSIWLCMWSQQRESGDSNLERPRNQLTLKAEPDDSGNVSPDDLFFYCFLFITVNNVIDLG